MIDEFRLKKITLSALGCFVVVTSVIVFSREDATHFKPALSSFFALPLNNWSLLILISLVSQVVTTLCFQLALAIHLVKLRFLEVFSLIGCNSVINLLAPMKAGVVFRAAYLKWRYGFSAVEFMALVGVSQVFSTIVLILAASSVLFTILALPDYVLIFFGVFCFSVLVFLFFAAKKIFPKVIVRFINLSFSTLSRWFDSQKKLFLFCLLSFVFHVCLCGRLWLSLSFADLDVVFYDTIFIYFFVALGGLVQLTPMNLGVKEVSIFAAGAYLGLDLELLVVASIFDRVAGVVSVILISVFSVIYLGPETIKRVKASSL